MTLTHAVLAVFMYLVFVFGGAWYATRPVKSKRGSVRIVRYTKGTWPYRVQLYGFWGWRETFRCGNETLANIEAERLITQERERRKPTAERVIKEYEV